MSRAREAKRKFRRELHALAELHRLEILHALLRILLGIERQGRLVLAALMLVVKIRVFFLQMTGIGQQHAA